MLKSPKCASTRELPGKSISISICFIFLSLFWERSFTLRSQILLQIIYLPARILEPLSGAPNNGANMQKSNTPAAKGNAPMTATMIPVTPVSPIRPQAINAMPAATRVIRPEGEAKKETIGFIF
jgi:hypothetical protein